MPVRSRYLKTLGLLVGIILSSSRLVAFADPYSLGVADMAKTPISERKVLVTDAEGAARVQANLEKFNQLLDRLNREMPRRKRPVIGIYLPVTEKFKDLLPATQKIEDAVKFFADVGLKPITFAGRYVSFNVHYDFLSSQGRANFWPADVLVIRFTVPSLESNADIEAMYVVLMNDSSL